MKKVFIIIILIVSIFTFLCAMKNINKLKENFQNNLRNKTIEEFQNNIADIRNMDIIGNNNNNTENNSNDNNNDNTNDNTETNNDNTNVDNTENTNNDNTNVDNTENTNNESVSINDTKNREEKKDDCLFGCGDEDEDEKESVKEPETINLDEMLETIEETEKICDLIEKKDKERKDKNEMENLERQLNLNRKFLVQQKAQNKQIEDLEKLVQKLQFDEQMKKVAVQKCGQASSDCMSDKETRIANILKQKEARKQNIKVNVNMDPFGDDFKDYLKQFFNLSNMDIQKVLTGINNGQISMNQLINGNIAGSNSQGLSINNNVNSYIPNNNRKQNEVNYDKSCPNCKVDTSEYIDRCEIPCKDCRDPAWKCPQDIKK